MTDIMDDEKELMRVLAGLNPAHLLDLYIEAKIGGKLNYIDRGFPLALLNETTEKIQSLLDYAHQKLN